MLPIMFTCEPRMRRHLSVSQMDTHRKRRRSLSPARKLPKLRKISRETKTFQPLSLLDLSARCVASTIPFQRVEEKIVCVPEPVQLRVVYWSFPRNEKDICMYSSLHTSSCHTDLRRLPFQKGLQLLENERVTEALQVGFSLSGKVIEVEETRYGQQTSEFNVSVSFDRCKITSVSCSCGTKDILWCSHVVAVSLFRIRFPERVTLRVPISETLSQMNRDQLQKLVQYMLSEHHSDVLPTAQRLADEILKKSSEINRLPGAPDPTAGASVDDDNCWHLDAELVRDQVRSYLSQGGYCTSGRQLLSMFAKVREMLRVHDKNGSRMLRLITEQFLEDPRLQIWKQQGTSMNDKCRQLWDQLGALWVCIVLNPDSNQQQKSAWKDQLEDWSQRDVCPLENPDAMEDVNNNRRQEDTPKRTIFSRAIQTCSLDWEDRELQKILGRCEGTENGYFTWTEDVPIAAARVDALRVHGYPNEAIALALAIARGMLEEQTHKYHKMEELAQKYNETELEARLYNDATGEPVEGWIGHPLDPIVVLYDTLIEAANTDDTISNDNESKPSQNDNKTFVHLPTPGRLDDEESYLTIAVEVAMIGLGQQRTMPHGFYFQDKTCRQEEHLIAQLSLLNIDDELYSTLRKQTEILYGGGPFSGLGLGIHHRSVPMHTFARFLFNVFIAKDPELAFNVGLRAMRFLVLDSVSDNEQGIDAMRTSLIRWYTLGHLESQQCELALRMLNASRGDNSRMSEVLDNIQIHVHSASQIFRLAQDALKLAGVNNSVLDSNRDSGMLHVAMELGLQALRMTVDSQNWRRQEIVQWSIECAIEVGTSALSNIMKSWSKLFSPTEATSVVAANIMAPTTAIRLKLTSVEREALHRCARALVLQCASREPKTCCLPALALCDKDPVSFETAYQLVLESASNISPLQIFAIARFMEHKNLSRRAFRLAVLAVKHSSLAFNQDSHPSIGDIQWTCALAHSLGRDELSKVIPLIVKAVHCPTVLSDILFRCAFAQSTADPSCTFGKYALCDEEPLNQLLECTINAYVNTAHSRLNHISPRHYADFIDFLRKAKEVFELAEDGVYRFNALLNNMKVLYKGKKKLVQLIRQKVG